MNEDLIKTNIELRKLSDAIKNGEIETAEAEKQLEELRAKKAEFEKAEAVNNAPTFETRSSEKAELVKAFMEKRAISISGTGITETIKELSKVMEAKKPILKYLKYFYGENANTVVPVWGSSLSRPQPVDENGNIDADATATLGNKTLTLKSFATSIPVSDETLKLSAVDFEAELNDSLADAYADCIAWEVFNGTNTNGHFESVLNAGNVIEAEGDSLKLSDLANLALQIADKTDEGVIFLSSAAYKEFIKDTSDEVYREDLIRSKMIENVPVIVTSYAPNSLASGSKIAVGGNFKDYAVALAGQLDITPKKQAGSLKTIFDVNCYMAGCPTVANNFFVLETK